MTRVKQLISELVQKQIHLVHSRRTSAPLKQHHNIHIFSQIPSSSQDGGSHTNAEDGGGNRIFLHLCPCKLRANHFKILRNGRKSYSVVDTLHRRTHPEVQ
ncbi:hypothetical protein KC19_VG211800 [Ceratodon purpureus]|uniref:Uncharacterized protein n=1 Tax=Ceratodon purpureus TaxID=3225 RepID=A0A8T0HSK8_CERPU|nr:hypothetical protein KC19_VG211800 [Ceratodon purpureus]